MSNVLSLVREVIAMNSIGDSYKTMAIRLVTSYKEKADQVMVLTRALNGAYEHEKAQAEIDFLALLEEEMAWEQYDDEPTRTEGATENDDDEVYPPSDPRESALIITQSQTM